MADSGEGMRDQIVCQIFRSFAPHFLDLSSAVLWWNRRTNTTRRISISEPTNPGLLFLSVTSRVVYMFGDIAAGPAYRFAQ